MTISKSLKRLFKTITGTDAKSNTAGDIINELNDNYPSSGGGATIIECSTGMPYNYFITNKTAEEVQEIVNDAYSNNKQIIFRCYDSAPGYIDAYFVFMSDVERPTDWKLFGGNMSGSSSVANYIGSIDNSHIKFTKI